VIAVKPLAPAAAYATTVTWRDSAGAQYTQRVSFRTGPRDGGSQTLGAHDGIIKDVELWMATASCP